MGALDKPKRGHLLESQLQSQIILALPESSIKRPPICVRRQFLLPLYFVNVYFILFWGIGSIKEQNSQHNEPGQQKDWMCIPRIGWYTPGWSTVYSRQKVYFQYGCYPSSVDGRLADLIPRRYAISRSKVKQFQPNPRVGPGIEKTHCILDISYEASKRAFSSLFLFSVSVCVLFSIIIRTD